VDAIKEIKTIIKKFFKVAAVAVFSVWFNGCVGKPFSLKNIDPKTYADVKDKGHKVTSSASGFKILLFIPIDVNTRHENAYNQLLTQANGDYITDIKIESWTYALIGTIYTTTLTAIAYPKK
jgi:hypothetical protein